MRSKEIEEVPLDARTLIAVVLGLFVYVIVGYFVVTTFTMAIGLILKASDWVQWLIKPAAIQLIGVIVAGIGGICAARKTCDSVLSAYRPRIVFYVFAVLLGWQIVHYGLSQAELANFLKLAHSTTALLAAWRFFWPDRSPITVAIDTAPKE